MLIASQRILIVEDEPAIARMYQYKLEQEGYVIALANNGREGLEAITEFKPDLILLDLRMPVMSGDEMLEELRSRQDGYAIKVIILTNISKDEAPQRLRFLDVNRYIVKAHHTPKQVVEVIRDVLK